MADVRGASGVPGTPAFGGISTSTVTTPLYVDTATGDLYVLINDVVTLVGSVPGGSQGIIAQQVFDAHYNVPANVQDANGILAMRTFGEREYAPAAVLGEAADILATRVFRPGILPATWG